MTEELIVKRPVVASTSEKNPVAAAGAMLAMVGLGVFFWLSSARAAEANREGSLPALAATTATDTAAVTPALPVQPTAPPVAASSSFFIPNSGPVTLVPTPAPRSYPVIPTSTKSGYASPTPAVPTVDPMIERMRAPALVIDIAQADIPRQPGSTTTRSDGDQSYFDPAPRPVTSTTGSSGNSSTTSGTSSGSSAGSSNDRNLSETERFSSRVGSEEIEVAQARRMTGLDRLVPQGAVIGAVMETALNSDQPGFARALTQRDMYSFDGSSVLIPAGSRLIGQYKSGVAQGASRLFVLWTRLIRPDGVSIDLASPATDDLGRGGIGGKVNRHFVQRFGGAILTTVLSGALSAGTASLSRGSTILVGSAGQASSLVSQAGQSSDIPPTITTRQGATIRVFVARDLDFTRVGPAR
jgi:type IV secretory pathway VirB10-like protein